MRLLHGVEKPARYIGGEWNSIAKERAQVRFALCFPDVYEIGMSHLGSKILYHVLNSREDTACERVYAPWPDMERALRKADLPLCSLETKRPLASFDIVGFSLLYEMCYTNILTMLDLAGIPLRAAQRGADAPLIVCGGPCACNPEPLAPFMDAVMIGDGGRPTATLRARRAPRAPRARTSTAFCARWPGPTACTSPRSTRRRPAGGPRPWSRARRSGRCDACCATLSMRRSSAGRSCRT